MRTWQRHNCERQHRTHRAFVKCAVPDATLIGGTEGPYATLARCGRATTVTLWDTREEADAALRSINRIACGGRCTRDHEVIEVRLDGRPRHASRCKIGKGTQ